VAVGGDAAPAHGGTGGGSPEVHGPTSLKLGFQ
jgi:hypothetical protein